MNAIKSQFNEIVKFKNETPLIKFITFNNIQKVFMFFVYVYLFLCAFRALGQIIDLIMLNEFYGNRIGLLFYFLSIVVVTVIVFIKRKNLNWVILDLIIITVLN